MASPKLFNDPFDCSVQFQLKGLTNAEINQLRRKLLKIDGIQLYGDDLAQSSNENLKVLLENIAREVLDKLKENFLDSNGVCCFSETNTDLLLWGHYADSFKGFCLEFNTDFDPFTKFNKVTYLEEFPEVDTFNLLLNSDPSFINDLFCSKSKRWAYEKEWRVLHDNAGTLFNYESKCLKAIYFGPRIEPAFFEILSLILLGQNPDVELWRGKLSKNKFNIEFERVNYIPYIAAKQQGLI